jgi:predicted P-loop ATPase
VIAAEQDRQRLTSQRIIDRVADGLTPDRRFLEVPVAVDRRRVRIDRAGDVAAILDRAPYDRYVVDVPRQCVFAGSVNPDTYLRDETGNRRFWPVRCGRIDLDALRRDRDQLWAEAVVRYRDGAIWWIDDRDLITAASAEQQARVQDDAWHGCIERWLVFEKRQVNRGYAGFDDWQTEDLERARPLTDVSVGEILAAALGIEPGRWTRGDEMRVTVYLKAKGWERYKARIGARADNLREWRYRR